MPTQFDSGMPDCKSCSPPTQNLSPTGGFADCNEDSPESPCGGRAGTIPHARMSSTFRGKQRKSIGHEMAPTEHHAARSPSLGQALASSLSSVLGFLHNPWSGCCSPMELRFQCGHYCHSPLTATSGHHQLKLRYMSIELSVVGHEHE